MIPDLSDLQLSKLDSSAEAKVYCALRDKLPHDYVAFFQVGWILRKEDDQARDGEADFILCHPENGFLCIEVKGGGVGFDAISGEWFSIDRKNHKHLIKDPINQALRAKYSVLTKLKENPKWQKRKQTRITCGQAIFFPDINDIHQIVRPDLPECLIGNLKDIESMESWVKNVFDYWTKSENNLYPMGLQGLEIFKDTFAHSFEVLPLISSKLVEQEEIRLRLTNDQMYVLDMLRSQRRAAISGGAGTGKTLLAVEKAKRLAADGFKTLLTCYNRPLADHLARVCFNIENLDVMSFHQLCYSRIEAADKASKRDLMKESKLTYPGADLFDVQYPVALSYSLDIVDEEYDAIVCDEGQDFREEYWLPIEMLLSNYETSPLYIFYDDNQNIYSRASSFPIKNEPFLLVKNCRNTYQIHCAAYNFYKGLPISPPDNQGEEIKNIAAPNIELQAKKIHSKLVDLIAREKVAPEDIVILVLDGYQKQEYYKALLQRSLPRPAVWLQEGVRNTSSVLIDSVKRFKGLEAQIIFLWGLNPAELKKQSELLYVGLSRAKSVVYVVGSTEACKLACAPDMKDNE